MKRVRRTTLLSLSLLIATFATAQTFKTQVYSVGSEPFKLIRADVNHDGAPDIITANSDGTVTILLNNGDGTFRRVDAVAGDSASSIVDIAAADVNKDGSEDLVVVGRLGDGTANLNLLLGRGDGTFNPPVTIATKQGGVALGVADFNGDGSQDIVFGWNAPTGGSTATANVTIYYGSGSGTFPTHTDMLNVGAQADLANGEEPYLINHINVGDFNHDFKQDFAFTECCGGSSVPLGAAYAMTNNGSGTAFTPHQLFVNPATELRVGDVDQNGATDLLVPYRGCHTPCFGVAVFTSPATNSQGTELPDPYSPDGVSESFDSATAADFGSGMAVAYSVLGSFGATPDVEQSIIAFAIPNSSGGFTVISRFNVGDDTLRWLTYADWNKDGKNDLAALSTSRDGSNVTKVLVFTNQGGNSSPCVASSNRTVKICAPAAGATVTSPTRILAGLRADTGIKSAQIYLDGSVIYQAGAGTTVVDQTVTMATGTHKITVKGWDASGSFSSSETVTVSSSTTSCTATANRTVTICSPANGATVSNLFQLVAGLRSDSGIQAAQIYIDGTRDYQFGAGTKSINQALDLISGTHKITVKGWDASGSFSSTITVNVSSSAPPPTCAATANRTVVICSPTSGSTVQSPAHLLAGLRSGTTITAAQVYLDGTLITQLPAGTTTVDGEVNVAPGSHKITVKGWDSAGSFSSSVTFNSI